MKIDFLGNFYLQPFLNETELNFFKVFTSGIHFNNSDSPFMGLYDLSISEENLKLKSFIFNKDFDLKRNVEIDSNAIQNSSLFPFLKSPVYFTEKAIKFDLTKIKNTEEFIFYIQLISQSIGFYFQHFFQEKSYANILDKDFFSFLEKHTLTGSLYFKLSEFGEIYRLTGSNDNFSLFKGVYPAQIRGKNYQISSGNSYDRDTKKQLESFYNKLSIVDIKQNAIFEQDSTSFSYSISEEVQKLLNYHSLTSKLPSKIRNKINKI